jgi:hypothetical protein
MMSGLRGLLLPGYIDIMRNPIPRSAGNQLGAK